MNPLPTTWPLERVLFAMAGSATLIGVLPSSRRSFVATGACPASLVLERAFGLERECRR